MIFNVLFVFSFYRDYRRYAATPGMIRYTLSPVLTKSKTDQTRKLFKAPSMTVQRKYPCPHTVHSLKKKKKGKEKEKEEEEEKRTHTMVETSIRIQERWTADRTISWIIG